MKRSQVDGLVRISKINARNRYNAGEKLFLCPMNLRPGSPWHPEVAISNEDGYDFDELVNEFEHYNCNYGAGYYAAFYFNPEER